MKILTELTQDFKSTYTVVNEDGSNFVLNLEFIEQQRAWIYGIQYGDFVIIGSALVVSPNILRQYKNHIPFGITISSSDGQDPFMINDFVSGRIQIGVLTAAEVVEVEETFYAPTT